MITSEAPIATDELRPYNPSGRTRITKCEIQDVTFANPASVRTALDLSTYYPALVGGKVQKSNLPDDTVYTSDLSGISGGGGPSILNEISFPNVDGSTFPAAITVFNSALGNALTTLPFTILFPKIAFSETYINSPPAGGIHLSRFCNSTTTWGHAFSLMIYPTTNFQLRHYGPSPSSPGNTYYRMSTDQPSSALIANPFSLVVVNSKTSQPKMFHNGNLLTLQEDVNSGSGPPANGWATAVADGFWILGMNASSSILFEGTMAPPMLILGALGDTEAKAYGRNGSLPSWAVFGTRTTEITSGTLLCGRKYKIVNNSGGANFTTAGAANNNVGTEFIVKTLAGVTPTWGTGAVVQLGMLCAPQAPPEGSNVLSDSSGGGSSMLLINQASSINSSRRGEFNSKLFWNNTHEAKQIYGSANYWRNNKVRINSITLLSSVNTTVDVGDGSSGTYYASAQSLTANVPLEITLAQKFPNGLRIVVDPASNITGTIDVTCEYTML